MVSAAQSQISARTDSRSSVDDPAHLTCCRSEWLVSLCGQRGQSIDLRERHDVCSMCVEEAVRLRPSILSEDESICPYDGQMCPDEDEVDAKAERFLGLQP